MNLGGWIVVLNSVLKSIPTSYLSFLKIPIRVIKSIIYIEREFIWGGVRGDCKINRFSWRWICLPKSKGGLGVKDMKLVNISLLTK